MKKIISLILITSFFLLNSCKKEEATPTTGTIKIKFNGTPSATIGQKVTIYFALDLYHLEQKIFEYSKVSNAPHQEITITDVKPQIWYYMITQSTPGIPYDTKGSVSIDAAKTGIVDVNF